MVDNRKLICLECLLFTSSQYCHQADRRWFKNIMYTWIIWHHNNIASESHFPNILWNTKCIAYHHGWNRFLSGQEIDIHGKSCVILFLNCTTFGILPCWCSHWNVHSAGTIFKISIGHWFPERSLKSNNLSWFLVLVDKLLHVYLGVGTKQSFKNIDLYDEMFCALTCSFM